MTHVLSIVTQLLPLVPDGVQRQLCPKYLEPIWRRYYVHALSEGGIFIVRTISIVRSVVYRYIVASNAVTAISIKKLVIEHLLVHIEQVGFGGLVFRERYFIKSFFSRDRYIFFLKFF